jgi:hypothetical protein
MPFNNPIIWAASITNYNLVGILLDEPTFNNHPTLNNKKQTN